MQQLQRERKKINSKKMSVKGRRQCQLLKEATACLKIARSEELGECASGIACQPAITQDNQRLKVCNRCREVGHLRMLNELCKLCVPWKKKAVPKSSSACASKKNLVLKDFEQDSEEQEALDSMSFDAAGKLTAGLRDDGWSNN